ncbi:MAG TPA: hypothetical protein VGE93_23325 [Bryobacteraceae bacterium]
MRCVPDTIAAAVGQDAATNCRSAARSFGQSNGSSALESGQSPHHFHPDRLCSSDGRRRRMDFTLDMSATPLTGSPRFIAL